MSVTWNATWHLLPKNAESPSLGDDRVRDAKDGIEERAKNEHTTYSGDGTLGVQADDWLHKAGSAQAWYQSGDPTQPYVNGKTGDASANGRLSIDSATGALKYYLNGTGWVSLSKEIARATIQGTLATGGDVIAPIIFPTACTITKVVGKLGTAPSGAPATVQIDLEKNGGGNSIFGTDDYIEFTDATVTTKTDLDGTNKVLAAGDYLEIDIDQVGGTSAGADLSLTIEVLLG